MSKAFDAWKRSANGMAGYMETYKQYNGQAAADSAASLAWQVVRDRAIGVCKDMSESNIYTPATKEAAKALLDRLQEVI